MIYLTEVCIFALFFALLSNQSKRQFINLIVIHPFVFSVIELLCNLFLRLIQLKIQLWRSISVRFQFSCFDLLEIHFVWLFFSSSLIFRHPPSTAYLCCTVGLLLKIVSGIFSCMYQCPLIWGKVTESALWHSRVVLLSWYSQLHNSYSLLGWKTKT